MDEFSREYIFKCCKLLYMFNYEDKENNIYSGINTKLNKLIIR